MWITLLGRLPIPRCGGLARCGTAISCQETHIHQNRIVDKFRMKCVELFPFVTISTFGDRYK